ncbi:PepSY domain-containing protein [Pseudoroseomonas wenyumeiae]
MEAGQIRPLAEVMASVEQRFIGKVVNIGLDRDQGRWLYHFKVLPGSGLIYKLTIDAASGNVVRSHGLVQERR